MNNNINSSTINTDNLKGVNNIDVKLSCKKQKRRFAISPFLTFRELMSTVRSLLNLDPHQSLSLRYVDSEGDKVTLSTDLELRHALDKQLDANGVLKLKVSKDKGQQQQQQQLASTSTSTPATVNTLSTSHSSESSDERKKKEKKREKKERKEKKRQEKQEKKDKCKDKDKGKDKKKKKDSSSSSSSSDSEKDGKKDKYKKHHHHDKKKHHGCHWRRKEEDETNSNINTTITTNNSEVKNVEQEVQKKHHWSDKWRNNNKEHKKDKALFARFVQHVSIEDQTVLPPGFAFTKTWRMRNEGSEAWPATTQLVFLGKRNNSERMGALEATKLDREVLPGQEIDISVPMVSPTHPGMYFGYYRLFNPIKERKFGQRVWVHIHVKPISSQ